VITIKFTQFALRAGSQDKYFSVTLCEAVIVSCIVKTALTSQTLLKSNCSYILMIMSYKT